MAFQTTSKQPENKTSPVGRAFMPDAFPFVFHFVGHQCPTYCKTCFPTAFAS
ncbi:hypothetical protein HMPREF9123_1183 [Neisseria bacilliformis ATCC BAA-1200]|uniref:Uncharacterized protein n=1 Tax=Neisseria bacilliformis ATCC BAA-1200 TaxID=888742 RepID=F2BBS8_9NEIS|nr:hypothetical protein HMPREF9123_1183 [Neisseria bacilliformis ATCC BAA-1200]